MAPSRTSPRPPGLARAAQRVRWDRVGRVVLLLMLGLILMLYVGPARSFVSTYSRAHSERAQVRHLLSEHRALLRAQRALRNPSTLERQARALGMVKPGERSYVISGLPGDR
jgi:hypothetical protein